MRKYLIFTISFYFTFNLIASACQHTIRLTDTYGDGWNGGTITVSVNGTPVLTNITMATLSGIEDFNFNTNAGDEINVTCTSSGSFPLEMRIQVFSGGGILILAQQQPVLTPGTTFNGACCVPAIPGTAITPSPSNLATGIQPCSFSLSWGAPTISGCNGATSYDVYFGTSVTPSYIGNTTSTSYSLTSSLADLTTYYWKIVPRNAVGIATGSSTWKFTTMSTSNPNYCFDGNAINYPSAGSNCAQMTAESNDQIGCIWNRSSVSFASSFDYTVNMYFGNNINGADGCAFVFQNSPLGATACGNAGAQLGAGGIANSVIIEFDTYDNDDTENWDLTEDHTAIEIDGDLIDDPINWPSNQAPLAGPAAARSGGLNLDDGIIHALRVTWNVTTKTMTVYIDGIQRLNCVYDFVTNVFGGNPNVLWGFTGATGGLNNQQYFCPLSIPLPVSLSDYSITCKSFKHQLDWVTFSEINNDYFTIEKSNDGEKFNKVAIIKGLGNSNETMHYSWLDIEQSSNTVYYKLSQIDFDGKNKVLGIQSIQCNKDQSTLSINLAFATEYNIVTQFETDESGYYSIEVNDITGQIIYSANKFFESGINQFDLSAPNMSTGMYVISIKNEKASAVRKFIAY